MKDSDNNNLENYDVYDITYKYLGKAEVTHRAMFKKEYEHRCHETNKFIVRPDGFVVPQYWEHFRVSHKPENKKTWYAPFTFYTFPYVPFDKVTKIVKVDTKKALNHDNIAPKV